MNTGSIVVKEAGKQLPAAFIQLMMKNNKSTLGIAYVVDGVVHVNRRDKMPSIEDLNKALNNDKLKNTEVFLWFGNSTDGLIMKEDLQPFKLLEKDGKTALVCFLDGDFSQFGETDTTHSDAYHAVKTYIQPKLQALYKLCGGDVSKLMDHIDDDTTIAQDMSTAMLGDRGSILFLAGNGTNKAYTVEGDETGDITDEYWVSNAYGTAKPVTKAEEGDDLLTDDEDQKPPVTPPVEPKLPAAVAARKARAQLEPGQKLNTPRPIVAANTPVPAAPDTGGDDKNGEGEEGIPHVVPPGITAEEYWDPSKEIPKSSSTVEYEVLDIPTSLHGKPKKKWIRARLYGFLPSNWHGLKRIRVRKEVTQRKEKSKYKPANEALANLPKADTAVTAKSADTTKLEAKPSWKDRKAARIEQKKVESGSAQRPKDTTAHHIPASNPRDEPYAMLSAMDRDAIIGMLKSTKVKTAIDNHSAVISDPVEYAKDEAKIPNLAQQLAPEVASMEETKTWPSEVIRDISRVKPDFGWIFGVNWRSRANRFEKENSGLKVQIDSLLKELGQSLPTAPDTTGTGVQDSLETKKPSWRDRKRAAAA